MTVLPLARRRPASVRVSLPDGGTAQVRPLKDGESAPLLEVFAGLSVRSRAFRYLTAMPRLPGPFVRSLSATDGLVSVAWLASVDDRPVGIGRYVLMTEDPCTADLAFEVVDEQQRRGLGTALLDTITTVAADNGVRRLAATVHPQNKASLQLLSRLSIPMTLDGGVLEGSSPLRLLDPPRIDRRAVVELARLSLPARAEAVLTQPCAAAAH
ncbi:MAG TPA: GNAT family N-acetyltransferase [Streptomyces sp.]|nr:GNAT family N-acetyltransferase [Streptomyces sp.]